jgi:hypothetical protein
MGCPDLGDGSAKLLACAVSSPLRLERLGSSLTDLDEELCPARTRRSSTSMKMNIMAALRRRSVCRR